MKQFINFCKRHLSEVVFAVWTFLFSVFFALSVLSEKEYAIALACGFLMNLVLTWLLAQSVRTDRMLNVLWWCAYISTLVMAVAFCGKMLLTWGINGYLALCAAVALTIVFCTRIAETVSSANIELEHLRNIDYNGYLRKMVERQRPLKAEEEETLLQLPDAEEIIKDYIQYCRFWRPIENKFLSDRRFSGIWGEYFKFYNLSDEQEMELFNRPDAKEIIGLYCGCSQMCERAELKLFTMPDAGEWVKMYIERGAFYSEKAEAKLIEMNDKELIDFYKSKYALFDSTYAILPVITI
ncbi:MAG: hypothetical protein IJ532_04095 [Alphaproteobacteria bacterium]|nr:hypothetical protein [Alphaproteobacteria bacterium]